MNLEVSYHYLIAKTVYFISTGKDPLPFLLTILMENFLNGSIQAGFSCSIINITGRLPQDYFLAMLGFEKLIFMRGGEF